MGNVGVRGIGFVAMQAFAVAIAWMLLYWLNEWLFESVAVSQHISWVFLPAALRMLAVLLTGWVGVLGLFVGSLITGFYSIDHASVGQVIALAGVSALAPMLALIVVGRALRLHRNLQGFNVSQLLILSLVCAGLTAGLHGLNLVMSEIVPSFFQAFVPLFVGDLAGTLIMLYLAKWIAELFGPANAQPT